jgi:hypothetical protein
MKLDMRKILRAGTTANVNALTPDLSLSGNNKFSFLKMSVIIAM